MRNAIVLLLICMGLVSGQTSPELRQAILDYQLTLPRANQLITAMAAMTKYVVSLPNFQDRLRKSMTMTPAEQNANLRRASQRDKRTRAVYPQL